MVLVYLGDKLHAVCRDLDTAEIRYGTAWPITPEKLLSGQTIYRLVIGA